MLYQLDVEAFRAVNIGCHRAWLDPIFHILTWTGDGWIQTALLLAGLLTVAGRRMFWPLAASLVFGGLLGVNVIKRLVPRDRPSNLPWAHPQENLHIASFPSGHTTSSFCLAVMLVLLTRGTRLAWLSWVAVGIATLVGFSRVYRGVHWPSDVIAGVFAGTFFASLVYLVFDRAGWLRKVE